MNRACKAAGTYGIRYEHYSESKGLEMPEEILIVSGKYL